MIRTIARSLLVALAVSVAVLEPAAAATVTWNAPVKISGPTDVSTDGSLFDSIMFSTNNHNASTTVNGVTFDRAVGPGETSVAGHISTTEDSDQSTSLAPGPTGNAAYNALLSWESYNQPTHVDDISLSGLTIGSTYMVQAWVDDSTSNNPPQNDLFLSVPSSAGDTVLVPNGDYITGLFTADSTTETLAWGGSPAGNYSTIDALQVRVVPEPSPLVALGGLGAIGLLCLVRRRANPSAATRLGSGLGLAILIFSATFSATAYGANAPITWTDGTFTTDAIVPKSNIDYAVGFGNGSSVTTASGVTFGPDNSTNAVFNHTQTYDGYLSVGGGTTGDAGFNTALTNGDWGGDGTLTLQNLTPGTTYEALLLVDDTRSTGRTGSVSDGMNSSSTIQFAFSAGTPVVGAYWEGLFTANATTETILVNNQGGDQLDALVLSTVPEPSSLVALGGLGAMGLFLFARRRKA
jgi:hypothetical protein